MSQNNENNNVNDSQTNDVVPTDVTQDNATKSVEALKQQAEQRIKEARAKYGMGGVPVSPMNAAPMPTPRDIMRSIGLNLIPMEATNQRVMSTRMHDPIDPPMEMDAMSMMPEMMPEPTDVRMVDHYIVDEKIWSVKLAKFIDEDELPEDAVTCELQSMDQLIESLNIYKYDKGELYSNEERLAMLREKREELFKDYDLNINMLNRKLRLSTNEEEKELIESKIQEWDKYAVLLSDIPEEEGAPWDGKGEIPWPKAPESLPKKGKEEPVSDEVTTDDES